jgi:hypothetical protein
MKLLILHPSLNSSAPWLAALQGQGVFVLTASSAEEAFQMLQLHAGSVDAAVVHREGAGGADDSGLSFISKVRAEQALLDLPMVVTSQVWGDEDFANHQGSMDGVNAYLRWDDVESQLYPTLCQMLGVEPGSFTGIAIPTVSPEPAPELGAIALASAPAIEVGELQIDSPAFQLESLEAVSSSLSITGSSSISLVVEGIEEQSPSIPVPSDAAASTRILAAVPQFTEVSLPVASPQAFAPEPKAEPEPEPVSAPSTEADFEPENQIPYLFGKSSSRSEIMPVVTGDAVVPGGAAQSPDLETVKHYLELREKDVSALAIQLRETKALLKKAQEELHISHSLMEEQASKLEAAERREKELEREKALLVEGVQSEIDSMRFEVKAKNDKIRHLQSQLKSGEQEMERLKDRVRSDLRSIKSNEKKLENQLDMLRRDSESLLASRESVIIELKRKLDMTEFNLDIVQDKLVRERERGEELKGKLVKASQAVRVAGGLLDPPEPAADPALGASGSSHGTAGKKVS